MKTALKGKFEKMPRKPDEKNDCEQPQAVIATRRLILRPPAEEDFLDLYSLWTDAQVLRYIGRASSREEVWARLLKYAGHWALFGFGYWILREKETGRFIGEVGVAWQQRSTLPAYNDLPEAGWVLANSATGQGFAREALSSVLDWTQSRLPKRGITCLIDPENEASVRLAESQGFEKFGTTQLGGASIDAFLRMNTQGAITD